MRNVKFYVSAKEVTDHINSLWQSQEFIQSSQDENGLIYWLTQEMAKFPRIFAEMSDSSIEWTHFYSWMNVFTYRYYPNPVQSDLYWLHEFYHAITMKYKRNMEFAHWFRAMGENELEASLMSEVLVYYAFPTLRAKSFQFEIWADRFLKVNPGDGNFDFRNLNSRSAIDRSVDLYTHIKKDRIRAMITPDPYDFAELQIANYTRQNLQWAIIWKNSFNRVNELMCIFQDASSDHGSFIGMIYLANNLLMPENSPMSSLLGFEHFINWVPFEAEAREFAAIANASKKMHSNEIAEARGTTT
jgi:hypothetical protein